MVMVMTSAKFNAPHLMGNCKHCYYFTPRAGHFDEGVCRRYPKPLDREEMDYCGEFAWKSDAALTKEATR